MRRAGIAEQEPLQPRNLRTPRAAAVAGIIFSALLITALVLLRLSAPAHASNPGAWLSNPRNRGEVAVALNLVPFAGIAFLWFIGVLRDRIGEREDRFFATVFLGSGLLFVAMMFVAAAVAGATIAAAGSKLPGADVLVHNQGPGAAERGDRLDLVEPILGIHAVLLRPHLLRDHLRVQVGLVILDLKHVRGPKLKVLKYKTGGQYKIQTGHRQNYTSVEVGEIQLG